MEVADSLIFFQQRRKAATKHRLALVFVKLGQDLRLRKIQAGFVVSGAHKFYSVFLPRAGTNAIAVECDFTLRPIFPENARLGFAERRQFVVVRLEERCLGVTDEIEDAHRQVGSSLKVESPAIL